MNRLLLGLLLGLLMSVLVMPSEAIAQAPIKITRIDTHLVSTRPGLETVTTGQTVDSFSVAQNDSSLETETEAGEVYLEEPGTLVSILSALIMPVLLLVLLFFFMRKSLVRVNKAYALTQANTAAVSKNNELLQESIELQKAILKAMKDKTN
ncbi:MAG: hypothetical protein AAFN40_22440 [Cyanobacteria bacterium J06560_6]